MSYRLILFITFYLFISTNVFAESDKKTNSIPPDVVPATEVNATTDADAENSPPEKKDVLTSLNDIWASLLEKQKELDLLQKRIRQIKDNEGEKQALRLEQDELMRSIDKQKLAFEQVAIGGLDVEVVEKQVTPEFDWKKELVLISRPLLDSIKELTEKPRKIEQLRIETLQAENLLKSIKKARSNIQQLRQRTDLPKYIDKQLEEVSELWRKREADTENGLGLAHYQLNSLQETQISPQAAIVNTLSNFIQGRGVTLMIAATAVFGIWILMRIISWILLKFYNIQSRKYQRKIRLRWARLIHYMFWALTIILSFFAIITVFYSRNDVLLLMLTVFGLIMLLIGLRNTLPRYVTEIRLLLDMGSVRQGERLIYEGIPYHLLTINVFSTLTNPELNGVLRLPTSILNTLVSRPPITDEPWFPCSQGDYILLEGSNRLAEVIKQSVEVVQLRVTSSIMNIPTVQFLQTPFRNLSRDGFLISVTFGVDYQHQAICLTEIPERFKEALKQGFQASKWENEAKVLTVDFKQAGTNSLDYLILVKVNSSAASYYFALERLVQKICVEVCNQENWVIPFTQLTLHAGDGFQGSSALEHQSPLSEINTSSERLIPQN
ncbi:MAG: hypothetical protein VSS52_004775 [Thiotrichaceae bacterium]|nr:hypothetical protein [Thiotrichaceae bacterium]